MTCIMRASLSVSARIATLSNRKRAGGGGGGDDFARGRVALADMADSV